MPPNGLPLPRLNLVRTSWIGRPRRSRPVGSVVVLCGCGRARVLDLRSRRSRLAAVAAIAVAVTLFASGAALLLVGAGAVVAAIAVGLEVATAGEATAMVEAGYCQRCTTTGEDDTTGSADDRTHRRSKTKAERSGR